MDYGEDKYLLKEYDYRMKLWEYHKFDDTRNNGGMFSVEFWLAKIRRADFDWVNEKETVAEFLNKYKLYNDSHDNIVAVLCMIEALYATPAKFDHPTYIKLKKAFYQRTRQPQDYLFMARWHPIFMLPFYLYSAIIKYKIRYHDDEWWNPKKYYFPLKLDGTRLYWMEKMAHMERWGDGLLVRLAFWPVDKIINWRWGSDSEKAVFDIYYQDPNHPIRKLAGAIKVKAERTQKA